MNWSDEPATWKQLRYLKRCGYQPNGRLTKLEAAQLLSRFPGAPPELIELGNGSDASVGAHDLRLAAEQASRIAAEDIRSAAQAELRQAINQRQQFWLDTCRGSVHAHASPTQILELYRKHGCLFSEPTHKQVQDILDALDAAMPLWDKDHPELFYQALSLNFPELLKQNAKVF